MKKRVKSKNPLRRMASRGFRGYPVASVAFYGPDNKQATKVAVGVVMGKDQDPAVMERWFSEKSDVRHDTEIGGQITDLLRPYNVKSVAATDRIIGCPHEEGKDYPDGEACPQCPFWKNIDRFTHEPIQ